MPRAALKLAAMLRAAMLRASRALEPTGLPCVSRAGARASYKISATSPLCH